MDVLKNYNLTSVARVLNGTLMGEDDVFSGVSTDTRTLKPGELFLALVGPNFDGHTHLQEASDKGAVAAVVSQAFPDLSLTQIKVENTRLALADMARARRMAFSGRVIGLTGSNGKTTVKELTSAVLKRKGKVLATKGNFNNDIGLPLTLLSLENDEAFAVIEMGANHHGEIKFLTDVARPDVALITNAGSAHLEGFGSVEGVAKAKGEIFSGLSERGIAIINADDQYSDYWQKIAKDHEQIRFGIEAEDVEIKALDVRIKAGHTDFVLKTPKESIEIQLSIGGKHNVSNALAAAAVAYTQGIESHEIKRALELFSPVKGRLDFRKSLREAIIIDDTYNANYDSTLAAINVLADQQGKKILILGDMLESGDTAVQLHEEIGRIAKDKGIDELLAFGELSESAVKTFKANGQYFTEKQKLIDYAEKQLHENVSILVKGSRGMHMEEIVNQLV